jgi:hypothetical protein
VAVDLGGNLNDLDEAEMDAVLAQLSEFRSLLAASQGEVNCSAHDHSDDD